MNLRQSSQMYTFLHEYNNKHTLHSTSKHTYEYGYEYE